jgi:hypothetical protein
MAEGNSKEAAGNSKEVGANSKEAEAVVEMQAPSVVLLQQSQTPAMPIDHSL